jgi:hypothetical protein
MKILSIILLAGLFAISCSSIKVTTDYDKTVDFPSYKSLEYFGWAEDSDKILNRFDKERIESAFGDEFKKRGIEIVKKGQGTVDEDPQSREEKVGKAVAQIMKDYPVQPTE